MINTTGNPSPHNETLGVAPGIRHFSMAHNGDPDNHSFRPHVVGMGTRSIAYARNDKRDRMATGKKDSVNKWCRDLWLTLFLLLKPAIGDGLHPYIRTIMDSVGNSDTLGVKISSPFANEVIYSFQTKQYTTKSNAKGKAPSILREHEGPAIDGFIVSISIRPLYYLPYLSNKNGFSTSSVKIVDEYFQRTYGYDLDSCMVVVTSKEGFQVNQNKVRLIEGKLERAIIETRKRKGIYHE